MVEPAATGLSATVMSATSVSVMPVGVTLSRRTPSLSA